MNIYQVLKLHLMQHVKHNDEEEEDFREQQTTTTADENLDSYLLGSIITCPI